MRGEAGWIRDGTRSGVGVWRRAGRLVILMALFGLVGLPAIVRGGPPLEAANFSLAAPQGFGDRQNSWAWSMQWWKGHLYVGTNRSWECLSIAALIPYGYDYPPTDPDVECTDDPKDLPTQAEIWRWTPPNTWDRVYQSPAIPIPGADGKVVGLDVGYRGMTIFKEPDGTEALYVTGVSSRFLGYNVPPPRILRSTDGLNFAPLPQEPDTVLGDTPWIAFRNPTSYNGRFYVQAGDVLGSGILYESANPAAGNDSFREVGPPDTLISAVTPYNGALYVGTRDVRNGYSVLKTDAAGSPPYRFTTIIKDGGYVELPPVPDSEVLSMKVFKGRLYIGTDATGNFIGPSSAGEVVRVNPNDTWDVVVGDVRESQTGWKFPISGYVSGFSDIYNRHMWRMEVFDDNLYVGTFDSRTLFRNEADFPQERIGFDLYRTTDGAQFFPITINGFDNPGTAGYEGKFDFGVRSMAATPYGLFIGTANFYYGLNVYRAVPPGFQGFKTYLPMTIGAQ